MDSGAKQLIQKPKTGKSTLDPPLLYVGLVSSSLNEKTVILNSFLSAERQKKDKKQTNNNFKVAIKTQLTPSICI